MGNYKTYKKGSTTKLSTNFTVADMACHGVGCCTEVLINLDLITLLQKIRDHFGVPVTVTSGYRCLTHNKGVGGATGSRHTKGDAADIVVKGVTPRVVAQYAESIDIKGIGLYETDKDGHFVHVDTRDYKSFWYGQAQKAMTTFGTYTESSHSTPTTNAGGDILSMGDKGTAVKTMQEGLIKLGYSCGKDGADGTFGYNTRAALRKFQSDKKLVADGIYGYASKTALEAALKNASAVIVGKVRVTANALNVRAGAGTTYRVVDVIQDKGVYQITEILNGFGRLADGRGWICLEYTTQA